MSEFEDDDACYVTEGLIQIWWNPKLSARESFHSDPPIFVQAYHDWMAVHPDVEYFATPIVGPPMWRFPSLELRAEFQAAFLETKARMEEIIQEGVAARRAEQVAEWRRQGELRNADGLAYVKQTIDGTAYDVLVFWPGEDGS